MPIRKTGPWGITISDLLIHQIRKKVRKREIQDFTNSVDSPWICHIVFGMWRRKRKLSLGITRRALAWVLNTKTMLDNACIHLMSSIGWLDACPNDNKTGAQVRIFSSWVIRIISFLFTCHRECSKVKWMMTKDTDKETIAEFSSQMTMVSSSAWDPLLCVHNRLNHGAGFSQTLILLLPFSRYFFVYKPNNQLLQDNWTNILATFSAQIEGFCNVSCLRRHRRDSGVYTDLG